MCPSHPLASGGNGETTREKGGENPPGVTLDHIVKNLLGFFNGFECLHEAKKEIQKENDIDKQYGHYCWSADDIKRAWEKTQIMDKKSRKRRHWARVIMLQVMKRYVCDRCKQNEEYGVEAECRPTTSTDVGPSPTEVNSIASVNNCEQQKNELCAADEWQLPTSSERDEKKEVPKSLQTKEGESCKEGSNESNPQTVYIRIPLSVMTGDASPSFTETPITGSPIYKLIDRVPNLTEIRKKKSYALLYDNRTRNAAWVYEILNTSTLLKTYTKKQRPFFEVDDTIHPFYRAPKSGKDYIGGYHRGHLAAAANHRWCLEAFEDTFSLSNMTPQDDSLNGGIWDRLEEDCRTKISKPQNKIRNIHVYTGPLYLPRAVDSAVHYKMITDKAVPTHFFKVIIVENEDDTVELKCYQMPKEGLEGVTDLEQYVVGIEVIERASGLIFRESSCNQGEIDSERTVTWEGNEHVATSQVKISTPPTNNNHVAGQ